MRNATGKPFTRRRMMHIYMQTLWNVIICAHWMTRFFVPLSMRGKREENEYEFYFEFKKLFLKCLIWLGYCQLSVIVSIALNLLRWFFIRWQWSIQDILNTTLKENSSLMANIIANWYWALCKRLNRHSLLDKFCWKRKNHNGRR